MIPFKVLFVDDEELSVLNFKMIFQDRYEILTAFSGEEGLKIFKDTDHIGLVISDQRMPGISGVEMLSEIYKINKDPIRMLLTAHSQIDEILDAINRGQVYQYILKPWDENELDRIIRRGKDLYLLKRENLLLTKELAEKNKNLELSNQELQVVNLKLEEDVRRRKKLEISLKESEEKFRKFTTASQDIFVLFDVTGRGIYCNPAAEDLLGYSADEFVNKPLLQVLHPENVMDVRQEVKILLATNRPHPAREVKVQKKNGEYLDVEVTFFCIDLESGERFIGSVVRDISQRKAAQEQLRLSRKRLGDLSAMLIRAQDDERRRIAMELHDEFGQSLAALKMQLRTLENKISETDAYDNDEIMDSFFELRQYVNLQIENVRCLSRELWPLVVDDLGVDAAFEQLFSAFITPAGIELRLQMERVVPFFSQEEQRHVYRLFQESLNNVVKHAQADSLEIIATQINHDIIFEIRDNGIGFDSEVVAKHTGISRGMGLQAMNERVRLLGGSMDIITGPSKGTTVRFSIPVHDKEK